MKILDTPKKKLRVLISSLLMLIIPEILYRPISYFILWAILHNDKILFKIKFVEEQNIALLVITLIIQLLGIVGLTITLFLNATEKKDKLKKIFFYFISFIFFLLICFIGFILFLIYALRNFGF